jgi:hypothetical protein
VITRGGGSTEVRRVPADWIAVIQSDRILLNRSDEQVEAWLREQEEES